MVKVGTKIFFSDQRFTSRQQLIQFMTTLTAGSAGQLATLQYLTHFSRDLDQPSYVSPVTDPRVAGAPKVAANSGGNTASGSDAVINPSFLATTVKTAFTRNDGSAAKVGDPFVKTRFNLNRLAWITYKGPLCDGVFKGVAQKAADINADLDLATMAGYLHDNYGLNWTFLQQGTAANIYKYFGLSWFNDTRTTSAGYYNGDNQLKWVYNHQQVAALKNIPLGVTGQILYLTNINGTREPDFFELLKAAIACGSKAKAATLYTMGPNAVQLVDNVNNSTDSSLDNAIIQIGANIIDQAKLDGYPSRILFSDGNLQVVTLKEFRGTESLPYIYGVRYAEVQAVQPVCSVPDKSPYIPGQTKPGGGIAQPITPGSPNGIGGTISTGATTAAGPLMGGTGAYVSLIIPEIWNVTDPNCQRCALAGAVPLQDSNKTSLFPTNFRVVAESIDPDHIMTASVSKGKPPSYSDIDNASDAKNTTTAPTNQDLTLVYDKCANSGNCLYTNGATNIATKGYANLNIAIDSVPSMFNVGQPPGTNLFTVMTDITGSPSFPFTAESTAIVFNDGAASHPAFFHEPTLLANPGIPAGLAIAGSENVLNTNGATFGLNKTIPGGLPGSGPNIQNLLSYAGVHNAIPSTQAGAPSFIGIYANVMPCIFYGTAGSAQQVAAPPASKTIVADIPPNNFVICQSGAYRPTTPATTFRLQYEFPVGSGIWRTFDEKYTNMGDAGSGSFQRNTIQDGMQYAALYASTTPPEANDPYNYSVLAMAYDPRSSRFGMVSYIGNYHNKTQIIPIPSGAVMPITPSTWVSQPDNTVQSMSSGTIGTATYVSGGSSVSTHYAQTAGFVGGAGVTQLGYFSQNLVANGVYYQDPDGITRRASGAAAAGTTGLPMAVLSSAGNQTQSRPIILHRPFRSVGELGYVFSGTPWKNLDFENSESGDSALLDVFAVGEPTGPSAVVAGKVNLNTQQIPVLQAILAGNYKDEETNYTAAKVPAGSIPALSTTEATNIATALTTTNDPDKRGSGKRAARKRERIGRALCRNERGNEPGHAARLRRIF